eukprot:7623750-Pyramimonas_sp.AAC.1
MRPILALAVVASSPGLAPHDCNEQCQDATSTKAECTAHSIRYPTPLGTTEPSTSGILSRSTSRCDSSSSTLSLTTRTSTASNTTSLPTTDTNLF